MTSEAQWCDAQLDEWRYKMTYANITIGDLLDTYMYAELPDNFEGIICDADKQAVDVVFNSQEHGEQTTGSVKK